MWSHFRSLGLAGCLLAIPGATQYVENTDDANGSQYLAFNGTVSATTTYAASGECGRSMGPHIRSYLYVGVNPPWDTNPFFFELYHLASEGGSGFITFTDDDVYNLAFASSAYTCWSNGEPCGFFETNWEYRPEILLDLEKSTVKKTSVGDEDGYEVTGDQDSYLKNTTQRQAINRVDVADGCVESDFSWNYDFTSWNESSKWTYTISFSESTATASIKTTLGDNTMEITYTGERMTNFTRYADLKLITSDDAKPQFRYSNDSDIHYKNDTRGTWLVSAEEFTNSPSSTGADFNRPTATGNGGTGPTGTENGGEPGETGAAELLRVSGGYLAPLFMLGGFFAL